VTDAPTRQADADENRPQHEADRPSAPAPSEPAGAGSGWAAEQPPAAPWYLGRPGAVPPVPPGWGGPGPGAPGPGAPGWQQYPPQQQFPGPPYPPQQYPPQPHPGQPRPAQAAPGPMQAPGQSPDQGANPAGPGAAQPPGQPAAGSVPPWTGTPPPNPQHPGMPRPGRPGPQQPPGGLPQQPWHDPNRYAGRNADGRPNRPPRQERPQRPEQRPGPDALKRPELDLRTRWARGLSLGAAACTLIALYFTYAKFPAYLFGAGTGLVLALAGLWLGTIAHRASARQGRRAPEAVGAIVWSAISCVISVSIVAFSLAFYHQLDQYSTCLRSATTISARQVCDDQLKQAFDIGEQ
jgi:hypothetical protein